MRRNGQNLQFAQARYNGLADAYARFIERTQLCDVSLWKKFVKVFVDRSDVADEGWRSEYWGKMMRGACMTCAYTKSEELYAILTQAVEGLLKTQDEFGRISGYDIEHEFRGWDVWGRKYVLVGLEYFYEICRDEERKERILKAMCRHADHMLEKIGDGEGKIKITHTSEWWGGVNSCTVLEPVIQLYKLTAEEKYKKFAEYIISTGGCRDGDLIECVKAGKKPHEYPEVKAYETMSFFEGLLAYYEISGEKEYLDIVEKFAEDVNDSDITIIGCAGCTHELFDNSTEKQTEYSETIMQETCVTVTWMRLCARLWENTHNAKYIDRIELSARNALYGSVNTHSLQGYSFEKKTLTPALPFDSYSPLYNNMRGRGIGGYKEFPEGGNYGCCACIGAAGTALYPLYAFVMRENTLYVNFYLQGESEFILPSKQTLRVYCDTAYPASGAVTLTVSVPRPERFALTMRVPAWCEGASVRCGNESAWASAGYVTLCREWRSGDTVEITLPLALRETHKNGKTAFIYGALTLARDEGKERGEITETFAPLRENGALRYALAPAEKGEQLRILLRCKDGKEVLLTDYASCGKNWAAARNRVSVWVNEV
ncbi:MAG: glycoside hydrolase family 127 protein [Clostridiales bacterium]|nr:glycoside hydrolase family 127 protein [Clostridiales bacterium]